MQWGTLQHADVYFQIGSCAIGNSGKSRKATVSSHKKNHSNTQAISKIINVLMYFGEIFDKFYFISRILHYS
jgi:hypothetical protein